MDWLLGVVSNIPALLCLVIGLAFVIFEMLIPGFGVPGITGILLLAAGIIIGTDDVAHALSLAGILVVILLIAFPFCLRSISKGAFSRSKLVLKTVSVPSGEHNFDKLVGACGNAKTMLRPSGIVEFGLDRVNVLTEGDFIEEGAKVRVERVEGNRVIVVRV